MHPCGCCVETRFRRARVKAGKPVWVTTMIQERYEGESYQEGNLGGHGKHMDSEFIQKVESMCFLTDWVWDEREREKPRMISKCLV